MRTPALLVALLGTASSALAQAPSARPPSLHVDGIPEITTATIERSAPYQNTRAAELLDFAPVTSRC